MPKCPTCGRGFDSETAVKAHHSAHGEPYWDSKIHEEYQCSPGEVVRRLHHDELKTLQGVADEMGCSMQTVQRIADDYDVELRDRSEGKKVMWEKMSKDEREQRVSDAHEKTRELAEQDEHNFSDWAADASEEEVKKRTEAAHKARREPPRLDVNKRGYERIRHGPHEIKHHRLLSTLLVHDIESLRNRVVHHEIPVWSEGPDEVSQAANFLANLELMKKDEHMREHIEEGDIPRDDVTGRFIPRTSAE